MIPFVSSRSLMIFEAYEEVISILGTDKTKEPSYEDLQNMRYVEMIIKESLRLYPPVPVVGRQIITDHETFEDLKLPRGAGMVVNVYTIHRDPNYYPDPNKFDPDRFLPGEAAKRPVGSYVPFPLQNDTDSAYEEVVSILGTDKTKEPSYEDLQNMRYVEMIIKESLRLYPPVPLVARQIITDNERYEDLDLPRGASMVVNIYTVHRDSTYYPEPNKFDPDRFLPGEAAKRPVGSFVPFLVGPRDCLGKKYAMLQMKTVASTILRP
ncbi:cytochrome P450 4C1-like [Diaphorina citri]|uniref:Cytochrome P450 4C1-like n=1 Tax=Diaphorina citri TaxID=121845 RepID=A0A3Q0J0G1_DIACI|nr:cytochrome P450 4C1-like [Diaphorina citri]